MGGRKGGRGGFGSGGFRSSGPRRAVKKFDPSLFLRKVEEQAPSVSYEPQNKFSDFLIEEQMKKNIAHKGYELPTPIQDQAIPYLLEGRDIIATANTGTGKTAAFLIPLINNVLIGKTQKVLIVTPTRELADQIRSEFISFARHTGISSALCIGGANIGEQIRNLKRDPAFVIGTPGRLLDLERSRIINFRDFSSIVLDEVDTMLDMGFINDIKHIITKIPANRHSLFFSATISKELKDVMNSFLQNPISINVKTRQSAENVNQTVVKIGQKNKVEILHDLLIKPDFKKVILFLRTKRSADKLATELRDRGFMIGSIHGDKTQAQRKRALLLFKANTIKVLLATDVVARGIDINDVSHVINFDMPQTYEDYIHRIGRTGRANKVGQAITFVD
jgi:superfamily II DNA/RNA helicase